MGARSEFSDTTRRKALDRAKGLCEQCGLDFKKTGKRPEYDHRLPCALGGRNDLPNCVVLCAPCHRVKTSKEDVPRIRKADRQRTRAIGAHRPRQPLQSPKDSLKSEERPKHEGRGSLPPRALYR